MKELVFKAVEASLDFNSLDGEFSALVSVNSFGISLMITSYKSESFEFSRHPSFNGGSFEKTVNEFIEKLNELNQVTSK